MIFFALYSSHVESRLKKHIFSCSDYDRESARGVRRAPETRGSLPKLPKPGYDFDEEQKGPVKTFSLEFSGVQSTVEKCCCLLWLAGFSPIHPVTTQEMQTCRGCSA